MNDENTESTTLTLGQTLKSSREQANVSLEELAKNLKLSVLQLQRLENDEHQLIGPATFVKGYAKSYCRAFNLDTAAVLALFPEPQETVKKTNMQSFSRRTEKEAHDSRLMLVSYVILAIVIGSSALWWWQNSTPLDEQVVTQSLNSFAKETVAVAQADPDVASNSLLEQAGPDESIDDPTAAQIMEQQADTELDVAPSETSSEPQNDGLGTIVMHFNEESWVEVHDGKGDKVAFGVKKAGYDMTLSGHLPFSIVLGKHQAVDITLDGEKIDISSFPKNRLAKFNLPLTE
ncbi:RodZ domain-containing protein [Pseudoalteromonas rhizosphaerae]|uniref:RodZ domain-containing protein n=1 Tax=Pseudoalteromonas rhizosphaerae TaxID=2518973 RepID=UPI0012304E85|nr:RodZ domain-containing protein [Pseudoalteromonas rhizosphaerae]